MEAGKLRPISTSLIHVAHGLANAFLLCHQPQTPWDPMRVLPTCAPLCASQVTKANQLSYSSDDDVEASQEGEGTKGWRCRGNDGGRETERERDWEERPNEEG